MNPGKYSRLRQRLDKFPSSQANMDTFNTNPSEVDSLLDVESGAKHHMSNKNFITHKPATMSFISQSKTHNEFQNFIIILTIIAGISLVLGFFSLSGVGIITITFALVVCIFSFWYCSYYVKWIMNNPTGTYDMKLIADYIKVGANAYLKTQYLYIGYFAIITCIIIFIIYLFRENILGDNKQVISNFILAILTSISFLIGSICSALAGYTGVWISVRCNLRVASAASKLNYINSFLLAFRGGAISSILSASMCILGISCLYIIFNLIFVKYYNVNESIVPLLLGGYGFGASFVALFMQLGGGIYTKAADVGADMCGKIEKGIPEDDARNPAVIADLVGDNVGDCAGSMADVFESIAGEMIGTMILGGTLCKKANLSNNTISLFIYFPIIIHSLDLVVSMIGIWFTKPKSQKEDAINAMKRGYGYSLILAVILYFLVCKLMLDYQIESNTIFLHYSGCGLIGLGCAYLLVLTTQYYTDYTNTPVKKIAIASKTGHGTNIIAGISVGMESTAIPVIIISLSLLTSYKLGYSSGIEYNYNNNINDNHLIPSDINEINEEIKHLSGLFGTACATMGMLCTAVFVLSMNNFGPIADNAGGVVEMSEQPHEVRVITDRLDAVGNVTKAATKGYAVGGSALACFLLFNAFLDDVSVISNTKFKFVDITKIEVMISGLIGIMMVFLFVGWSISAVGKTAEDVVKEVRRQFREIPGIMEFKNKPDYKICVEIVTKAALKKMMKPALLALLTPIFVGILFRFIGQFYKLPNDNNINLLGVECLSSFLIFGTLTGLLMAIFLDNSGGAWDNAKKLIESKNMKDSYEHKAAVTGDTVGDPFKDTAGPALHVVMTTMSTTSLVLAPLFIGN